MAGLYETQQKLSKALDACLTDKDKIKLLLDTLASRTGGSSIAEIGFQGYAIGYLEAILSRHGL